MRAYLIDPQAKRVTETEYNGDFKHIYDLTGCDTFDVVGFGDVGDGVYVDDEGLLKGPEFFFQITGCPSPLAGKGLVLGSDDDGNSIEPKITIDELRALVTFSNLDEIGIRYPGGDDRRAADRIDGFDRDDLGESPDY